MAQSTSAPPIKTKPPSEGCTYTNSETKNAGKRCSEGRHCIARVGLISGHVGTDAFVRPAKACPERSRRDEAEPGATTVGITRYPFSHRCKPNAPANPAIVQK